MSNDADAVHPAAQSIRCTHGDQPNSKHRASNHRSVHRIRKSCTIAYESSRLNTRQAGKVPTAHLGEHRLDGPPGLQRAPLPDARRPALHQCGYQDAQVGADVEGGGARLDGLIQVRLGRVGALPAGITSSYPPYCSSGMVVSSAVICPVVEGRDVLRHVCGWLPGWLAAAGILKCTNSL